MQKLVELGRVDTAHGFFFGDETFARHIDGDLETGLGRAFAAASL